MIPKIEHNCLIYKKMFAQKEIPVEEIRWVYLQVESGSGHMCCGDFPYAIYRVLVHLSSKEILTFQYEKEETAKQVLDTIAKADSHIAVGFTEENKARFL